MRTVRLLKVKTLRENFKEETLRKNFKEETLSRFLFSLSLVLFYFNFFKRNIHPVFKCHIYKYY